MCVLMSHAALSVRLGLPKPGVRLAPAELLESVLGVGRTCSEQQQPTMVPSAVRHNKRETVLRLILLAVTTLSCDSIAL